MGGQPNTTAGNLSNLETDKMSGWGKLPLSLIQKNFCKCLVGAEYPVMQPV